MTYTITCPDPDCKTVFELEEADFDPLYEDAEPISCPGCEVGYEWTFDPDAKPEITLTEPAEYDDEDGEDADLLTDDTDDEG